MIRKPFIISSSCSCVPVSSLVTYSLAADELGAVCYLSILSVILSPPWGRSRVDIDVSKTPAR